MKNFAKTASILILCIALIGIVGYSKIKDSRDLQQIKENNGIKDTQKSQTNKQTKTSSDTLIYCIGDEYTNDGYPNVLGKSINATIKTYAYNQYQSKEIAITLGAYNVYTNAIKIPAQSSEIAIQLQDDDKDPVTFFKTSPEQKIYVSLDGIEGTLQYNQAMNSMTFKRSQDGEEKTLQNLTHVDSTLPAMQKDSVAIILTGNNDIDVNRTLIQQKRMLDLIGTDRYIIISLPSKNKLADVEQRNQVLQSTYNEHYLDFRTDLLESALKNKKLTSDEQAQVAQGFIPSRYLNLEGTAGNETFNKLLAESIEKKLKELKYIK